MAPSSKNRYSELIVILRHSAALHGLSVRRDGYVKVQDILRLRRFRFLGLQDVQNLVGTHSDDLELVSEATDNAEEWSIRARSGHSMMHVRIDVLKQLGDEELRQAAPVYRTTATNLKRIQVTGAVKRQHHRYISLEPNKSVDRINCVLLTLDVARVTGTAIKFFRDDEGSIFTPGDADGSLPLDLFLSRIDIPKKRRVRRQRERTATDPTREPLRTSSPRISPCQWARIFAMQPDTQRHCMAQGMLWGHVEETARFPHTPIRLHQEVLRTAYHQDCPDHAAIAGATSHPVAAAGGMSCRAFEPQTSPLQTSSAKGIPQTPPAMLPIASLPAASGFDAPSSILSRDSLDIDSPRVGDVPALTPLFDWGSSSSSAALRLELGPPNRWQNHIVHASSDGETCPRPYSGAPASRVILPRTWPLLLTPPESVFGDDSSSSSESDCTEDIVPSVSVPTSASELFNKKLSPDAAVFVPRFRYPITPPSDSLRTIPSADPGPSAQLVPAPRSADKWLIMPVSYPGSGKTGVCAALAALFGFHYVHADGPIGETKLGHEHRRRFLTDIARSTTQNQVVLADRNNHQRQHRTELREACHLAAGLPVPVKTIALRWPLRNPSLSATQAICMKRIFSWRSSQRWFIPRPGESLWKVLSKFLLDSEPLGTDEADVIIDMDVSEDLERALSRVVKALVPLIGLDTPSRKRMEEAVKAAHAFHPYGRS